MMTTWAKWIELAGSGVEEALDDAARAQGEWLSALMQCQMEAVEMLLDLGRPALQAAAAGEFRPFAWLSPWFAAGLRPIQIS